MGPKTPLFIIGIALGCLLATFAWGQGLGDGLVGHWNFERGDGKTLGDLSSLGNHGSITDGEIRSEKNTRALIFDGMDTSVAIAQKKPFGITDKFTLAAWVWQDQSSRFALLLGFPHPNPNWTTPALGFLQLDRRLVFGTFNQQANKITLETKEEVPLHRWVHLAATYDGQKITLYVNGQVNGEKPHSGAVLETRQGFFFGNPPTRVAPPFQGRLGEVRLWKRPLAPSEILKYVESSRGLYGASPGDQGVLATRDGTVLVESPGSSPGGNWRPRETRVLEKLAGFSPGAEAPRVNGYGGWLDSPKEKATGFFRTQKISDRWWLVDPEGQRAIHIGMDQVAPLKVYEKVLATRFGTPENWARDTSETLRGLGFYGKNTRNTNEIALMRAVAKPLVYTLLMRFASSFAEKKKMTYATAGHTGFTNECIPVFHPEFDKHCDEQAKGLIPYARDPYFLGMFSDNELQCPLDLLDRHLGQDPGDENQRPGIDAARNWLLAKKGSTNLEGLGRRARLEFIAYVFDRYYRTVIGAIRKVDTNHLYIGTRICYSTQFDNPYFMKMCRPYLDVISVNYYGVWGPDLDQMSTWQSHSGLPILFSEWYAKAEDSGLANTHGAGWLVHNQEDRGAYYQHTALGYLESKSCIGWHWFKYQDDSRESKALDAAGGANKGMFDTNYTGYGPLTNRAGAVNRQTYALIEYFDHRQ